MFIRERAQLKTATTGMLKSTRKPRCTCSLYSPFCDLVVLNYNLQECIDNLQLEISFKAEVLRRSQPFFALEKSIPIVLLHCFNAISD